MKRYSAGITIGEAGEQIPWMYEDPEGEFVLYDDVAEESTGEHSTSTA